MLPSAKPKQTQTRSPVGTRSGKRKRPPASEASSVLSSPPPSVPGSPVSSILSPPPALPTAMPIIAPSSPLSSALSSPPPSPLSSALSLPPPSPVAPPPFPAIKSRKKPRLAATAKSKAGAPTPVHKPFPFKSAAASLKRHAVVSRRSDDLELSPPPQLVQPSKGRRGRPPKAAVGGVSPATTSTTTAASTGEAAKVAAEERTHLPSPPKTASSSQTTNVWQDIDEDEEDKMTHAQLVRRELDAKRGLGVQRSLAVDRTPQPSQPEEPEKPEEHEKPLLPAGTEIGSDCLVYVRTCHFIAKVIGCERKRIHVVDVEGQVHKVIRKRLIFWHLDEDKPKLVNITLGETRVVRPVRNVDDATATSFADFSYARQVEVLRPHLLNVINEQYVPAQWRIDKFRQWEREKVFLQAGDMTQGDRDELVRVLKQFVYDQRPAAAQPPQVETPPASADNLASGEPNLYTNDRRAPPFWAMNEKAQLDFITDVLLYETVIAIAAKIYRTEGTDEEQYRAAIRKLTDLQSQSVGIKWEYRAQSARNAIRRAREKAGLDREQPDAEETTFTRSNRAVKKVNYTK